MEFVEQPRAPFPAHFPQQIGDRVLNIFKKTSSTPAQLSWDPFQEMRSFFNLSVLRTIWTEEFNPAFEVKESRDGYLFRADVPGVKESDLEINLHGAKLHISGRRVRDHHEAHDTVHTWERGYGTFQRVFTLPTGVDVDQAKAELTEGVLTVRVPRADTNSPRKISVTSTRA
jgi:HSP20 family protein